MAARHLGQSLAGGLSRGSAVGGVLDVLLDRPWVDTYYTILSVLIIITILTRGQRVGPGCTADPGVGAYYISL